MREVVRDGKVLGIFAEGTRQLTGVPGTVQPGAAMAALQEDVPVVCAAIHGSQTWKLGSFAPVSIAWGEPMRFDGLPRGGKGYREASVEIERELHRLWGWLADLHAAGGPRPRHAVPPRATAGLRLPSRFRDVRPRHHDVHTLFVRADSSSQGGTKVKRSAVLVSIVVGVGALIVGSSALAGRQPEAVRSAQARTLIASVNVTATEFKFVLSKKTAKRGLVIFKVKNAGKLGHDFQINGRKTPIIPPGKSNTLRVTFLRKGHYAYKCTVPGHAAAGMKGVFTIT